MKCTSFLAAYVLLCAGTAVCAQTFVAKRIQFKGVPDYTDSELLRAAQLTPGSALTQSQMQEHGQKLMDSGLFESLTFRFEGETLTYMLTPAANLLPVRIGNLPLGSAGSLDPALRARVPLYQGKVPQDGDITKAVSTAIEELLAAKGLRVTVRALMSNDPSLHGVSEMEYTVTDPPIRVGAIQLDGASAEMLAKARHVAESLTASDFDTEESAANVERAFVLMYSDEGFAQVKVHAEQSGSPVQGNQAIDLPFAVSIVEGRRYKLGTIRLPSGAPLSLAELSKAAGIGSSPTEKMDLKMGMTIRTALEYVAGQYKTTGHLACVVTPHPDLDETAGVANYRISVEEGPVYSMGKLIIENGADDLRAAMLAAWKLPEGSVFNQNALSDYFHKQGNTPLGRTFASAICKYKLTRHEDTHTVDVTLRIEHKP